VLITLPDARHLALPGISFLFLTFFRKGLQYGRN
jgi:hypothetical protein